MKCFIYLTSVLFVLIACDGNSQEVTAIPAKPEARESSQKVQKDSEANSKTPVTVTQNTTANNALAEKKTSVNNDISALLNTAKVIIESLKRRHFNTLSTLVDPEEGLTFSPYVNDKLSLTKIDHANVASLLETDKTYIGGRYDGSGAPIELTAEKYIARFVYDIDYQSLT